MAPRGRRTRTTQAGTTQDGGPQTANVPLSTDKTAAGPTSQATTLQTAQAQNGSNVIRKGINISALIYVEGDQPAPDDFISLATSAIKQVLDAALPGSHSGLDMTLKRVQVVNNVEDEEDTTQSGGQAGFQF